MSRFVAYLGEEQPVGPLVYQGDHPLHRQSWAPGELLSGAVTADGWGVVWYHEGRPRRLAAPRPIWHEEELEEVLDALRSTCVVAALRRAPPGQSVDRASLLPLVHDRYAYVLDGFVPDFHEAAMRPLRAGLPDDLYAALRGGSDAETLFLLTLAAVREGAGLAEALEATARKVKEQVGSQEAQMNMLLTDGETVALLRSSTVLVTNSLYTSQSVPFAEGGTVVASEPLDEAAAWSPVDGHHRLEIRRDGPGEAELVFF